MLTINEDVTSIKEVPHQTHNVARVNSIKETFTDGRQRSKTPTFALQYGGTYHAIVKQCGIPEESAKLIEARYHELYKVSDDWVSDHIKQASELGYVELAFGLRLRTPTLPKVVLNTSVTPYAARSESRTAGNALGQSWGLLNNRAASEFMGEVRNSSYAHDIKPIAHIHDAQYYLVRDRKDVVEYCKSKLESAMGWQDHPQIANEYVKLSGTMEIYPSWANEVSFEEYFKER